MIGKVIHLLKERTSTLAVAESCTGGRLAAAFTAAAGASEYFLGGVVAYDNKVKTAVLGVERDAIEKHGAVSRVVAQQMARGVQKITGADLALATTGVAGPGGGSPEKPVGTIWIAVATSYGAATAQKFHFTGTRTENMDSAVDAAIGMLSRKLTTLSCASGQDGF